MRRILQLLWIALPGLLSAQQGFNLAYDLGYARNQLRTMIVHQDTVVAVGIARADTFPYPQCLLIARFDSSGAVLDHHLICDSLGAPLSVAENWTDLVATSDGGYACTAACVGRHNGMFVKFASDLSVEFIREYVDTVSLVDFYNAIIELPDGYLLGGYVQAPNYLAEAFLRRVDKQGNSMWFSYYGDYNVSDAFSTYYQINDSLSIFAGSYKVSNNTLSGRGPWICVIKSNGEIVNQWHPDDDFAIDFIFYIHPYDLNNWVVYGMNTVSGPPFQYQPFLALLDTSFQLLSVRPFDPIRPSLNFLEDVSPTTDGNFIGAGLWYSDDPNNEPPVYGRLFKFSPEPDSLWSLTLTAPVPNVEQSGSYFGGIGELSSGNMIAGGYAVSGNDIYPWLVKVTPDGCVDTLWCVTVPTHEPWGRPGSNPAGALRVRPNPTYGPADLSGFPASGRPMQGYIFDATGRVVEVFTVPPGMTEMPLSLATMPRGLYEIALTDEAGQRWRARVVRQ